MRAAPCSPGSGPGRRAPCRAEPCQERCAPREVTSLSRDRSHVNAPPPHSLEAIDVDARCINVCTPAPAGRPAPRQSEPSDSQSGPSTGSHVVADTSPLFEALYSGPSQAKPSTRAAGGRAEAGGGAEAVQGGVGLYFPSDKDKVGRPSQAGPKSLRAHEAQGREARGGAGAGWNAKEEDIA